MKSKRSSINSEENYCAKYQIIVVVAWIFIMK